MKFSIVVPIYKVENYLFQCVNSLLRQQYTDYEVILVDDGSPDNCPKLCDDYAKKDSRVKVIHKTNGGLVSAREAGVKAASGEYIGYVDGDDWVEETLLETLADIIHKSKADIINFNFYNNIDGVDKKHPSCKFSGLYQKENLVQEVYPNMLSDNNEKFFTFGVIPAVWCKFYKREILIQNLCKNQKLTFGEDVACVYQAMLNADSIYFCDEYMYHYRRNRGSMTKAYNQMLFSQCEELLEYLEETIPSGRFRLQEQLDEYTAFILFKCVLNEARANEHCRQMKQRLSGNLKEYGWLAYIRNMEVSKYPLPYKVFFSLLKKEYCGILMILSNLLLKIYR